MPDSIIHIDGDTINAVLKTVMDKPGGPQLAFEDGKIVVRMKGMTFAVNTVQMTPQGFEVKMGVVR